MTTTSSKRHSRLVGFRLAARLARREITRRPGRTLLVALLVALPVAGMTVASVMVRTQHETPLQLWHQQYGEADATFNTTAPLVPGHGILARLPKSTIADGMTYVESRILRTTHGRLSNTTIQTMTTSDPITRGIVQVMSGRAPSAGGEVFLSRDAARDLGVKAGDTLRLDRPARRALLVTGVGELAVGWGGPAIVLPSDAPYPWKVERTGPAGVDHLIKFAQRPSAAELHRMLATSISANFGLTISPALVTSQFDSNPGDTQKKVAWSWVIGALVLTVVGIVIAAAFAVGARRQLVTLGQLSGNGAAPKVLRRVLFLQGTWTGVVGTIGGLGLGALSLAVLAPHADQIFRRDVHPYIVRPIDVVPIILLGIGTATVAALVPARAASRVPVLAALAGRRPLGRVPRWIPVTGAIAATGGLGLLGLAVLGARGSTGRNTVWVLTAMAGSVAVLLGACAIAPLYVSVLEPAAAQSRGAWRVATRSLARQRTRTSAVVSAIAATSALVIATSSLLIGAHEHNDRQQRTMPPNEVQLSGNTYDYGNAPPPAAFLSAVTKALPHTTKFQLRVPYRPKVSFELTRFSVHHGHGTFIPAAPGGQIYINADDSGGYTVQAAIADRALTTAYGLSASDQRVLTEHGVLVLGPTAGKAGVALIVQTGSSNAPIANPPRLRTFDAPMVDSHRYLLGLIPAVLVTPAKAAEFGMTVRPSTIVLRTRHSLTTEQRDKIGFIVQDATVGQQNPGISYQLYYPPTGIDPLLLEWLLVGVALVLTLFVVAVNLALSATETRDERDVLTIMGAAPGAISRANGYKAGMLTAMGALFAIPMALLPVAVFLVANNAGWPFVVPVRVVMLLVIALPIAAGVVTTAASALALRVRPVHVSMMAFD